VPTGGLLLRDERGIAEADRRQEDTIDDGDEKFPVDGLALHEHAMCHHRGGYQGESFDVTICADLATIDRSS
jgi:hypothetical protein